MFVVRADLVAIGLALLVVGVEFLVGVVIVVMHRGSLGMVMVGQYCSHTLQ